MVGTSLAPAAMSIPSTTKTEMEKTIARKGRLQVAAWVLLRAALSVSQRVAAGWLASLAAGAVAGGAAGGIVGALVKSGTSKENAALYAEALRRGGAVVTAKVSDDDAAKYKAILSRNDVDVASREAAYRSSGWLGYDQTAQETFALKRMALETTPDGRPRA